MFPWLVSTNAGGSQEYLKVPNSVFRHFLAMSNELSTTKVLLCPEDKERTAAIDWRIGNQNISYFVGLNASETNANSILSGDRNLMTNGVPVGSGLVELTTKMTAAWTAQIHKNAGNVLFGDGHVDALSKNRLQEQLINSGVGTNRLLVP
jgi:prepilin-type processing-associated H-X9-DG protein